jgi:hypothetical protein
VAARHRKVPAIGDGFHGLVRRTLLLNCGILLSTLVMGIFLDDRGFRGVVLLLLVTTAILWCATFAIAPLVWLWQVFGWPGARDSKPLRRQPPIADGVADEWLDDR